MLSLNEGDINISKFDKLIVMFRADWCPFCRRFQPIFDSYDQKAGIKLAEAVINEDENPLWDKFKIKIVPTIIAFYHSKEIGRRDGKLGIGLSKDDVESLMKEIA